MAIARDEILLDGIKEALGLYQRSLVWATTAALSGALIALRLRETTVGAVPVLGGALSPPIAWAVTQVLYLVFGWLAYTALRRCLLALRLLDPPQDIREAIRFFPSLATMPGRFFRLGSVLLPLIVTAASWLIELQRESAGSNEPYTISTWLGFLLVALLLVMPYQAILSGLKELRMLIGLDNPAPANRLVRS